MKKNVAIILLTKRNLENTIDAYVRNALALKEILDDVSNIYILSFETDFSIYKDVSFDVIVFLYFSYEKEINERKKMAEKLKDILLN